MTREEYIEVIQSRLKRIDSTATFNARYVEGVLDVVWQNMIFDLMGKRNTDPFFYSKKYTPVVVAQDANNRYYSDLPDKIIHLPRVSSGIVRISQLAGTDMDFAPISERDFVMMRSQEVFQVSGTIYYYVTSDSVHYGDNMTTVIATAGVEIDMIIPFRSYDLDDDIPIPDGQTQSFIAASIEYLANTRPVDLTNKNAEA